MGRSKDPQLVKALRMAANGMEWQQAYLANPGCGPICSRGPESDALPCVVRGIGSRKGPDVGKLILRRRTLGRRHAHDGHSPEGKSHSGSKDAPAADGTVLNRDDVTG